MDLVEIRKKAKKRASEKGKTGKEKKKAAGKPKPEKEHSPLWAEEKRPVDPPLDAEAGEGTITVDEDEVMSIDREDVMPSSVQNLDDVLMSQREAVKEEEEEQLQLLTFRLGAEEYALNIMDIKEIIRVKETTEVPKTPDYILGIFSLRGTIIPVFDVSLRMGLPRGDPGSQNRIIVVKSKDHFFGLYVDSVVQVMDIPLSKIEPPPEILGGVEGEFLRGIGRIDERLIILLNLGKILKIDDGDDAGNRELQPG